MADEDKKLDKFIAGVDDPAPEHEGDVKEGADKKDVVDAKDKDIDSSGKEVDDGAGVVKKLMTKIGIGKKGADTDDDDGGKDIPDAFTNFARAQGWSDEDIAAFAAQLSDEELLELTTGIEDEEEEEEEPEKKKKKEDKKTDKQVSDEEKKLLERIEKLEKTLEESTKQRKAQDEQTILETANKAFDEAGKEFEIFGKTEELPRFPAGPHKGELVPTSAAFKARSEVWNKAVAFINLGATVQEAMDDAVTWYKGKNLEKDIHRKIVKDLKGHEKKLSAKRTGKETVKQYEDEDERKADVVREAARRAGIKGHFDI